MSANYFTLCKELDFSLLSYQQAWLWHELIEKMTEAIPTGGLLRIKTTDKGVAFIIRSLLHHFPYYPL